MGYKSVWNPLNQNPYVCLPEIFLLAWGYLIYRVSFLPYPYSVLLPRYFNEMLYIRLKVERDKDCPHVSTRLILVKNSLMSGV